MFSSIQFYHSTFDAINKATMKAFLTVSKDNQPVFMQVYGQSECSPIHLYSKGRAVTYYKEDARFQENVYGDWWDSGDYGCLTENGTLLLKDRQVDVIDQIDSNLALEDMLLDHLDFLSEVVVIRDNEGHPQPIVALVEENKMDWDAWWQAVNDLPLLKEPIILAYEDIPRTATMKVQRLQMEASLKEEGNQ